MSKRTDRAGLIVQVAAAAAQFGAAADAVDEAVAATLGVNQTDLRILGAVHAAGQLTASDAAAAATLSPGATSTAIQRLVAAGLVVRRSDPTDRRRAALSVTPRAKVAIENAYGPLAEQGTTALDRLTSAELAVILRFLNDGSQFQREHAARVRRGRSGRA